MKTYDETSRCVLQRVNEYEEKQKKHRERTAAVSVTLLSCAAIALLVISKPTADDIGTGAVDTAAPAEATAAPAETSIPGEEPVSASSEVFYRITQETPETAEGGIVGTAEPAEGGAEVLAPNASITTKLPVILPEGAGSDETTVSDMSAELPKIKSVFEQGAMGFEGYIVKDASELVTHTPWNENMKFDTLPVYKNLVHTAPAGYTAYLVEEELDERANETADILGLQIVSSENGEYFGESPTGSEPDNDEVEANSDLLIYKKYACADNTEITVTGSGAVNVFFREMRMLPDGIGTLDNYDATIEYLKTEYAPLFGLTSPVNTTFIDRNIYGEKTTMGFGFYESTGEAVQDILNQSLTHLSFYCGKDDSGSCGIMHIRKNSSLEFTEKLGDYPIITIGEAREKLLAGNYVASLRLPEVREEDIAKSELLYRSDSTAGYYQPYYRFFVKLDHEELGWSSITHFEDEYEDYAALYVPAVRPEYLSDIEVWDGSFNG